MGRPQLGQKLGSSLNSWSQLGQCVSATVPFGILLDMIHAIRKLAHLLFTAAHIHPTPQHVVPSHTVRRASEAILVALAGDLCTMVHPNFRECPFRNCLENSRRCLEHSSLAPRGSRSG